MSDDWKFVGDEHGGYYLSGTGHKWRPEYHTERLVAAESRDKATLTDRIRDLEKQVDELTLHRDADREKIKEMQPFYDALRGRHNGYTGDPMFRQPKSPEHALSQLIGEAESLGVTLMQHRIEKALGLPEGVSRPRNVVVKAVQDLVASAAKLHDVLSEAIPFVSHHMTRVDPGHSCGLPGSNCDCICVEAHQDAELLLKMKDAASAVAVVAG